MVEARRRDSRRALVFGAGLLALAGFASLTGALPRGIIGISVVLGVGLLIISARLARRYG